MRVRSADAGVPIRVQGGPACAKIGSSGWDGAKHLVAGTDCNRECVKGNHLTTQHASEEEEEEEEEEEAEETKGRSLEGKLTGMDLRGFKGGVWDGRTNHFSQNSRSLKE